MTRLTALRWGVLAAAAGILGVQLFVPPIVGLSDQGDFARMIGRFGYGPEDTGSIWDAFVKRKYVPDPSFRYPSLEQPGSEYLFVGSAVALNKVVSKDGKLDIRLMGLVHVTAFLAAFAYLLWATPPLVWFAGLLILTDVGYAAYWNSFYAEPASCIFLVLLIAESVRIRGQATGGQILRWSLWAALLVLAKSQNLPLALVLAPFALIFSRWRKEVSIAGCCLILIAGAVNLWTLPKSLKLATTYNVLFMSILPESKNPKADLAALGLDPQFSRFSGSGAWTQDTALYEMAHSGLIGQQVTSGSIVRFYLSRPARMWRHVKVMLPIAFSLRPEWCGNFERSAGFPPGAKTRSFSLWSVFHERALALAGKAILVVLLAAPIALLAAWARSRAARLQLEFSLLLVLGTLIALAVPVYGEAWDNVKHMFLFNLLLDASLVWVAAVLWSARGLLQSNK